MDFIRINDERVKISNITSYCEMQFMITDEELADMPAYRRERLESQRYALSIFCDGPRQNERAHCIFKDQEELDAALARLDAALPKFFRANEWRTNIANVVRVSVTTEEDDGSTSILLHTPLSVIHVRENDETKRNELLARIDSTLESL
jgi:hypothetical protein